MTHNCRQINNYYIRVIIVAKIFSVSNKRFRIPISHFVNFWKKSFSTHYSRQINYHYSRVDIVAKIFWVPNKRFRVLISHLMHFWKIPIRFTIDPKSTTRIVERLPVIVGGLLLKKSFRAQLCIPRCFKDIWRTFEKLAHIGPTCRSHRRA